jgi:hypothetical protein
LGRAVYSDSASKGCISVAEEWLRTCLHEHKECSPLRAHASPLPTRVIDVGDEDSYPRLVTSNGKTEPWIALSYCWGGDSQFVFNDRTMHDLHRGIPLDSFPATLRDSVVITRTLGIKYIWIDALCIKQDSTEDWVREAAKMREVYSGAILTIVDANSPSTHSGIFSQRKPGKRATLEWRDSTNSRPNKVQLRPGSELWDHALSSSPLMSRGWTLQEGLLSPRTISYGAQQMIWECPCYQADEGGRITQATEDYRSKGFIQNLIRIQNTEKIKPQSFLEKLVVRSSKPEKWWKSYDIADPYDKWNDIAEQFMCRSLTKDFDALPALSGLARVFQHVLNDEYCAGLWKKDILSTLMWNRSPRYPADLSTRFDLARPSDYLAPSWSWTSILGKQSSMSNSWQTREALQVSAHSVTKIVSLRTFPKDEDPFGQVTGGELVLHTRFGKIEHLPPVYSIDHEFHNDTPKSVTGSAFQELVYTNMRVVDSMVYEFFQKHSPCENQEFGAVELVRWEQAPGSRVPGIDLLLVESTGQGSSYRRIAQLSLRKSPVPNEDDVSADMYRGTLLENNAYDEVVKASWKKRTVTLV